MTNRRMRFAIWWRRSGMGLRMALFVLVGGLISLLLYWQRPEDESAQPGSNLLIFLLVNSIIIVLCLLAFLIGRNVVKLVFDRRRKILGSKLRLRLVFAFVGIALVPTVILFVLASGLLSRSMENWFSSQVEATVSGALEVAKEHHQLLRSQARRSAVEVRDKLQASRAGEDSWTSVLEGLRKQRGLFGISLVDSGGTVLAQAQNAAAVIDDFKEPAFDPGALARAFEMNDEVRSEEGQGGQFIRVYLPITVAGRKLALVVSDRISPEISQALTLVNDSFKEYEQIKLFKNPLKSAYILTLTAITMIIIFAAVWFGFYIAREISVPIQHLAEGTRAVAKGNLEFRIRESGDDELSFLVRSFNTMIGDLKSSRSESEERRLYLETILGNLAVAVIAIDSSHAVTSINPAAAKLFSVSDAQGAIGNKIEGIVGDAVYTQFSNLLSELEQGEAEPGVDGGKEREISLTSHGRELKVLCTVGKVLSKDRIWLATVLIFDDITEISKAQHMSAWREVAQRIAHEIKNPLTPIQLSAQRLQKLLAGVEPNAAVSESTQTIIDNVNSIKRLVNEFSHFARMPVAEFRAANLNELIADTLAPFAETHSKIVFQFIADHRLPDNIMDREQVRRILINLIDNAIASVNEVASATEPPKVVIKTAYDPASEMVSLEVADNGSGISESNKARLFEPYFTTKSGGTGLGLAIVYAIVSDHQGEIRAFDAKPRGARFVVEMPIRPRVGTQRKLAGG